ncbi:MAG: HlyD family efflux transporter periplasmic adaptor subunit [Symploca sp. SIO3E6]|nr:HlyD family efflux transporter periplasmic adaptor subunit [Caldora sp. SIO3E6]
MEKFNLPATKKLLFKQSEVVAVQGTNSIFKEEKTKTNPSASFLRHKGSLPPAFRIQKPSAQYESLPNADLIYGGTAVSIPSVPSVPQTPPDSPDTTTSKPPTDTTNAGNWSTSLQTVLDQPPPALPGKLMLGALVFCVAFGAWATLGKIDEVGHSQGKLVPKGQVYKVSPIEMDKVASIQVKEGQAVKKGQVLVELNTELATTEVERLEQLIKIDKIQLNQQIALMDRTRLEAQTRDHIAKADVQAQQATIAQANAKAETLRQQLIQLQSAQVASQNRLKRLEPLAATAEELLTQRRQDLEALKQRRQELEPVLTAGAISKEYIFSIDREIRAGHSAITQGQLQDATNTNEQIFQAQQSLRDQASTMVQTQGNLDQTLAEIKQLQAGLAQKQAAQRQTQLESQQQIQKLEVEQTQLKAKIADNQKLLASAQAKLQQKYLYAPVDGTVSSLNISNIGEVVQPSQTIAEIAPQGVPLVLSAKLPNSEAGFIKKGMPVQVKFDAYPYQEYGIVSGKVTSVSADAKADQQLGSVYKVEVGLEQNYVEGKGQTIPFKAGQTANADIIIRRRRIVDILLEPFQQLQKGGISL